MIEKKWSFPALLNWTPQRDGSKDTWALFSSDGESTYSLEFMALFLFPLQRDKTASAVSLRFLLSITSHTGHLLIRRGANILTAHHSYTSSFRLYWLCAVLSQNSFVNILLRSTVTALINNGEDSGAFYIVLNLNPIISGVFLSLLLTFSLLELMD